MRHQNKTIQNTTTPQKKQFLVFVFVATCFVLCSVAVYFLFFNDGPHNNPAGKEIKNVILITVDTLRADYVSYFQAGQAHTPHIDQLATEGNGFESCIAQSPITLPSHTSILSGTYPLYHQVRDNGGLLVPQQLELISETLKENGFLTSAFIGAYVLHSKWGINQGFDTFSDDFDLTKYKMTGVELEKRADEVLANAKQWLTTNKKEKFFTWIHLFDPHAEYQAPAPFAKKHPDNPYADEVEYTDDQLGQFFQFLKDQGLYDNSLIILTADHGEGLWEHQERTHAFFVYNSTVWVPLIIHAPVPFAVKRVKQLVESVDIAPTILDLLGIKKPSSYQGQSLLPLLIDPIAKQWEKKFAYSESYYPLLHLGWAPLQTFYLDNWKYIRAPKEELFNLEKDKKELNNLVNNETSQKEILKRRLLKFISDQSKNALAAVKPAKLDADERHRLESLGYLTTQKDISNLNIKELADPKDKVDFIESFDKNMLMMSQGKYLEVIDICQRLLKEEPGNVDVLILLGVAYSKSGKPQAAIPLMYEVLKNKPDYNDAMINLVLALNGAGQPDLAITEAQRFLQVFPQDNVLYNLLGNAQFLKGDYPNALSNLEKSLQIEPHNSKALLRIGEIYLEMKDFSKANEYIQKALQIFPNMNEAYFLMGRMAVEQGDTQKAEQYYRQELQNFPENYIAAFHLAEFLKKAGRLSEAIPFYEKAIKGESSFRLPYFMLAQIYLELWQDLPQAIALCKTGIGFLPADEATLFGYYILTNIYARLGDKVNFAYYTREGDKLNAILQQRKQ